MGKRIEVAILEDVEHDLRHLGYQVLKGSYSPTEKNHPVEKLYDQMGYQLISEDDGGEKHYEARLALLPKREYYAELLGFKSC